MCLFKKFSFWGFWIGSKHFSAIGDEYITLLDPAKLLKYACSSRNKSGGNGRSSRCFLRPDMTRLKASNTFILKYFWTNFYVTKNDTKNLYDKSRSSTSHFVWRVQRMYVLRLILFSVSLKFEVILVTIENSLTSTNQAYKDVIDTNFHSHVLNPLKTSSILWAWIAENMYRYY